MLSIMQKTKTYCTDKEGYAVTQGNWNSSIVIL